MSKSLFTMLDLESQARDVAINPLAGDIAEEDVDESNANFSENEGQADPVIASSPAFSNTEFK